MDISIIYVYLAIVFGFFMAFGIGANDVSNAMGTSVGSKAITIKQAIIIAAIFEFAGAFLAGGEVTNTIGNGIIKKSFITEHSTIFTIGMLSSLLSSAIWLVLASYFGLPVSTTHTLIGAILGFSILNLGFKSIKWFIIIKIFLSWVLSPILGGLISYLIFISIKINFYNKSLKYRLKLMPFYIFINFITIIIILLKTVTYILSIYINLYNCFLLSALMSAVIAYASSFFLKEYFYINRRRYNNVENIFSILMVSTSCGMAFAHGSNDVSNAIAPVLAIVNYNYYYNLNSANMPVWVPLLGATGILLGLITYGKNVISTIGNNITNLNPSRGFSVTLSATITVILSSALGLPVSTTHTLIGSIIGVGIAKGIHSINVNVIRNIFISWLITIPAGAVLSIFIFKIIEYYVK